MNHPLFHRRRGVVSLLALIIMATVTSAALGSSIVVVQTLQESENLDEAVIATYAAESGLEQGLHVVKMSRKNNQVFNDNNAATNTDTFGELNDPYPNARTVGQARWSRSAENEKKFVVPRLGPDESVSMDLFDPDAVNNAGAQSLGIDWGNTCSSLELEVTVLGWQLNAGTTEFDAVLKQKWPCNDASRQCKSIPSSGTYLNSIDGVNFVANRQYRVTFKAITPTASGCSVQNLVVKAYPNPDGVGDEVPIRARISVKSTGTFLKATQAVSASVPWKAPASDLLNFVVFSEEQVTK